MQMKHLIDMSAERGQYICQSQSLNLWMKEPTHTKLNSMHFYSWNRGLKTGIYYLRRQAVAQAQQFTIEPTVHNKNNDENSTSELICESCSA
jgi:ribonucleoside-diphosphate reductase alpha chain